MSIDHAILGFVLEQPAHGYSVKKWLESSFSSEFGINDGQLYPALARLEARGWIKKRVVPQRRSPAKHLWRVTPAGEREFQRWLGGDVGEPDARAEGFWKQAFLQRCAFFRHLDRDDVRALAERELERATRRGAELERAADRLERAGSDPYRRLMLDYGIRYQRMRREWLLELLARAAEPRGVVPPTKQAVG